MAYENNTQVAAVEDLGLSWDDITGGLKKGLEAGKGAYDSYIKSQAQADMAKAQAAAAQAKANEPGFFSKYGVLLLIGGVAIGGIYLLTRK